MKIFVIPVLAATLGLLLVLGAPASSFPKGSPRFDTSFAAAVNQAKQNGKPIVAVVSAPWCAPCVMMKKDVYASEAVRPYHDRFNWVYLDYDDPLNTAIKAKFGVQGIPHIQFLDATGKSLDLQRGPSEAKDFARTLHDVLRKASHSSSSSR